MRNYKSISNYFEYYKLGTIKDVETGYIYSLDYCTRECYSINQEDDLRGIEAYFFRLSNNVEIYWDEPCMYL